LASAGFVSGRWRTAGKSQVWLSPAGEGEKETVMDTLANMMAAMKNAIAIRKETVDIPHSRIKEEVAKILLGEGYIGKYDVLARTNKKFLRIGLKYTPDKKSVIGGMKRISKSSRRVYAGAQSIPRVHSGFGTVILSTSKGLMTDEAAREKKLGGEVIGYVW
jgi:small subunit ribosomal protein S8